MLINRVPIDSIASLMRKVEPLLEPALAVSGETDLTGARARFLDGTWALWTAAVPGELVGVAVTEIRENDTGKSLLIYAGGAVTGHGEAVVRNMWPVMRAYAGHYECRRVQWFGRPGWRRSGYLPKAARHVADVMEVTL